MAPFVTSEQREEKGDLGLGRIVSNTRGRRLLNPDGSFNVVRDGLPWHQVYSAYHDALTTTWPRFLAWTAVIYLGINLVFASFFLLLGPDVLAGPGVAMLGGRVWRAFFFSVQTFATIGYGSIIANGVFSNLVVTVEAFTGLLAQALITGLLFARFARPTMALRYTSIALIAPFQGGQAFMFRVANMRRNELIDIDAKVSFSILDDGDKDPTRRFHALELERRSVNFLPLSWTLVHPITPGSPLWGLTAADLERRDAEVLVLMQGTDDTFATRVASRRSYRSEDIVWGAKFASVFTAGRADGRLAIDMARLDQYERVARSD